MPNCEACTPKSYQTKSMPLHKTEPDDDDEESLQNMARHCHFEADILRRCAIAIEFTAAEFELQAAEKSGDLASIDAARARKEKLDGDSTVAMDAIFDALEPLTLLESDDRDCRREIRKAKKMLKDPCGVVTAGIPSLYELLEAHEVIKELDDEEREEDDPPSRL
jgi:hypothetical protein